MQQKRWAVRRHTKSTKNDKIANVKRKGDLQKERACSRYLQALRKEVHEMPDGYTPYGYLGKIDDRLIEVVSEEELYELLLEDK